MIRASLVNLVLLLLPLSASAQDPIPAEPPVTPPVEDPAPDPTDPAESPTDPVEEDEEKTEGQPVPSPALAAATDPAKLFQKGFSLGRVGDKPSGSFRRLVQRTVMIGETQQDHGVILTFDDQIIPTDRGHSSALEIAKDLQPRGVRAIFFANVPAVSEKSLNQIRRRTSDLAAQKKQVTRLLNSQRARFVEGIRELLRLKKDDQFICEVFNHTAFHQNMTRFKVGESRMELAILGIRFVEGCLDEAYAAERPGTQRMRYFRFPFLAEPRDTKAKAALNDLFTELGLISLGETQDSKDFDNYSSKRAYQSLKAAHSGKRYDVKKGAYGIAEEPIALFHTKTWSKIRTGVLKFLEEHPIKPKPQPATAVTTDPLPAGPASSAPLPPQ